jgi:biotin carboxylase
MSAPVLVLAGGAWQVPIIQFLKGKGHPVFVVDPYTTSPGVKIADGQIVADVRDLESIKLALSNFEIKNWAFVVSDQSDVAMLNVANISSFLGLPGNDPEVVLLFTNKFKMREFASQIGVPVPKFETIQHLEELIGFLQAVKRSVMLKPADSQSSRGIFKLNPSDFKATLETAFRECKSQTPLDYVLVEEFFEGIELTVEGFCNQGKHRSIAISKKKHFRVGIASDLCYPADIEEEILQKITKANDLFVEKSGLSFGITHAEYLVDLKTGDFILVEIACRGGGSLISSHIAPWVSGWPSYEFLYKSLLGEAVEVKNRPLLHRSAILHFFEFPNGTVQSIDGVEKIMEFKQVLRFQLDFEVGTKIQSASDDRSRQGFVILLTENQEELNQLLARINEMLKVSIL